MVALGNDGRLWHNRDTEMASNFSRSTHESKFKLAGASNSSDVLFNGNYRS